MEALRRFSKADNVYEELALLRRILQIYGLAPFFMKHGKPKKSLWFLFYFCAVSSLCLYCLHDYWITNSYNRVSRYTLTILVYQVLSLARCSFSIFAFGWHFFKARTCIRVWEGLEDVNRGLFTLGIKPCRWKVWNTAKTLLFVAGMVTFIGITYNLQTNKSKLTATFWVVWFIPLLQTSLTEFTFHMFCCDLRRKVRICNRLLAAEASPSASGRHEEKSVALVRSLRNNYHRLFEVSKNLNSLYGIHFLYIFVAYFVSEAMDVCNLIRLYNLPSPRSVVRFRSALYWSIMQMTEILLIIFSGGMLRSEVNETTLLLHKYIIQTGTEQSRLKIELQSFCLQIMQCPLTFTAAGFFRIDHGLLIQLCMGIISNALFLIQMDKLKRKSHT